jgi:hypothetical protein
MFRTTNMFIWFLNGKYIQDEHGQILLEEKPVLSFEYDIVRYYWSEQIHTTNSSENEIPLTEEQKEEIETFIKAKRQEVGISKLSVDSEGNFLGLQNINNTNVFDTVDMTPPNGDDWLWEFESKQWIPTFHYNVNGHLTNKSKGDSVGFTKKPYPKHLSPLPHKFDIEKMDWVLDDSNGVTTNLIRNKVIIDTINKYIQSCLSIVETPETQYQLLVKMIHNISANTTIQNMSENERDEINVINNDLVNFSESIAAKTTLIDVYVSGIDFNTKNTKVTPLYVAPENTITEIVVDQTIAN